jgi:hypothetical protein
MMMSRNMRNCTVPPSISESCSALKMLKSEHVTNTNQTLEQRRIHNTKMEDNYIAMNYEM